MMKRPLLSFLFPIFCLFSLQGQESSLQGRIRSSEKQAGLQGVNVVLRGTGHGTISSLHGEYLLEEIPEGEQTILFSFMGYETREIQIVFQKGIPAEFDLEMVPGSIDLSAVTVEAHRPVSAASSKAIRDFDLKIKPARSAQDLLQLVPGLVIAQHAGGGKAEQIFMRGFDADHGTDVGIYVDGMPVNMVTHGHGQGYADLHFVIPEIIEGLEVYKGPYFARFGNFGTAGSVDMTTTDHPEKNLVKMEGGMFNTAKATTVLKIPTNGTHQSAYVAGQYYHSDGPVENPQGFNRANIFAKFHTHLTQKSELGLVMGAFTSNWNASGQIPQRAVDQGAISRWGAIDPLEGGVTSRYNLSIDYHFMEGYAHDFQIQAYVSQYDFKLYSNFTFWLNDPEYGDMIEQNDHRSIYGITTKYTFYKSLSELRSYTRVGASYRGDRIDLSLWKSPDRIRMAPRTDHRVNEANMALWVEQDLVFSRMFKLQLGLRGDYLTFNVIDHLESPGVPDNGLPHASGYAGATILSPKLNLVFSPTQKTDIYLNGGTGFHSNDARDVLISQQINQSLNDSVDHELTGMGVLPRATGFELGLRTWLGNRVMASLAAWTLHLEEELVFVGDEGTTEVSGETRRLGVDAEVRIQIARWIWADLDLNLSDGRYVQEPDGSNYIPLAPRFTSQGGISFLHPKGLEGALRYRYISDRPANEDNSVVAPGYGIINLIMAYRFNRFRIFTQVENLLNATWNEAQFETESRLYYESSPVSEIHFTPGNPINFQMGISYEF